MLEQSSLFVKEMQMFFGAQFQTQACFETPRVSKHLYPQKYFFSMSIQLKLR